MKTLNDLECANKRFIVRVDYNVPLQGKIVQNADRINSSIDTIKFLLQKNARQIILISHLGQPKGRDEEFSLFPAVEILTNLLGEHVGFSKELRATENRVTLLENLRFYEGEINNDQAFAKQLASMADIYVNDAFSCSHRNHASVVLLPTLLPSFVGMALMSEIRELNLVKDMLTHGPVVLIVGGAKISTKLPMIKRLQNKVDKLVLCGALANTVLRHKGYNIGKSAFEDVDYSNVSDGNLILPQDVITSTSLENKNYHVCDVRWIPESEMILDVGPATIIEIKSLLNSAKTVLWNGPLGAFEFSPFDNASLEIGNHISNLTKVGRLNSILGGGDTLAMISKLKSSEFSYVSNAGGAFLKWLECGNLVGLDALCFSGRV